MSSQPDVVPPARSASLRAYLGMLLAAALVTGAAWTILVPPFESVDESGFYQLAVKYSTGRSVLPTPLFFALAAPALKAAGVEEAPFEPTYNPSFRFVSNARGEVNMFMHGPADRLPRSDITQLYVVRAVVLTLSLVTLAAIFAAAWFFFERADLAFLTAGLCLFIPQFSLHATTIHTEASSTLVGAVGWLVIVGRATGQIGRRRAWLYAVPVMVLAPFADRQAYFLFAILPLALLLVEPRAMEWLIAVVSVAALGLAMIWFNLVVFVQHDLTVWFGPLRDPAANGLWGRADTVPYLFFEFAPKFFFSFFGWLGVPSILLPPWLYAAFAVLMLSGAIGLLLPRAWTPDAPFLSSRQKRAFGVMSLGILAVVGPILYTNLLITRNSWYGRWLFPAIGPLAIIWLVGARRFAAAVRAKPATMATLVGMVAAAAVALWLNSGSAAWVVRSIRGNHYGDQEHLISTVRWTVAMLTLSALGLALNSGLTGLVRRRRWTTPAIRPAEAAFACGFVCNLLLLVGFVWPLYRPLDAQGLDRQIRRELDRGERQRAGRLYEIAVNAHPGEQRLRSLGLEHPLLFMVSGDRALIDRFKGELARGARVERRDDLMALARTARIHLWRQPELLDHVLREASAHPELAEPAELLRLQLEPADADDGAARVLKAAGGTVVRHQIGNEARLEGFTVHERPGGGHEVVVYFRPLDNWIAERRMWIHAYWAQDQYVDLDVAEPPYAAWKLGELAWESFVCPPGRFTLFTGVAFKNLGPAAALGVIGE